MTSLFPLKRKEYNPPYADKPVMHTFFDSFHEKVKELKAVSVSDLSKEFNVSHQRIEEVALIFEKQGLMTLLYRFRGSPIVAYAPG